MKYSVYLGAILALILAVAPAYAGVNGATGAENSALAQEEAPAVDTVPENVVAEGVPAEQAVPAEVIPQDDPPQNFVPTQVTEEPAPAEQAKAEEKPPVKDATADMPDSVSALTGGAVRDEKSRFGGLFVFGQSLGLGTFISDSYARQPYYGWNITISPRLFILDNLWLQAAFTMQGELTQSYTSSNTYSRQFMPGDLFLTLKGRVKIPVVKMDFLPYLRLGAPTSAESRTRDLFLSTAVGFDLTRLFGKHVLLGYTFRFNKNWNGSTNGIVPAGASLARLNGAEDAGSGQIYNGATLTSEFSVFNRLMASFIINDEWSISLILDIQNAWTYRGAVSSSRDQYTSENAKTGRGQSDITAGTIDISYQPFKHVGFSLGMTSTQPAFTADNKSLRFPFFDFSSEGNNFTQFYFEVQVTY